MRRRSSAHAIRRGRRATRHRRTVFARPGPEGEAGAAPIEFVTGLGLLVLPVVVLVVSLPVWAEVQAMGRLAAQQAARTIVTASEPAAAMPAATAAAESVAANYGRELAGAPHAKWTNPDGDAAEAGEPGQAVTVTVAVRMPALPLPLIGDATAFDWEVAHTEVVDRYRSLP